MDMALHLGMTAAGLSRAMSEREMGDWQRYAVKRMLPQRRVEMYLAQIALVVAKAMGGAKDASLSDFMFDPESPEDDDPDDIVGEAREFFGFSPRNKG